MKSRGFQLLKKVRSNGNKCVACGKNADDLDHIKTKGSGGKDDESNLWFVCRNCHIIKHAKGLKTFIKKHPHLEQILRDKGYELVNVFGVVKLRRRI